MLVHTPQLVQNKEYSLRAVTIQGGLFIDSSFGENYTINEKGRQYIDY